MKITESRLRNVITECFNEVINEDWFQDKIKEKSGNTPFDLSEDWLQDRIKEKSGNTPCCISEEDKGMVINTVEGSGRAIEMVERMIENPSLAMEMGHPYNEQVGQGIRDALFKLFPELRR